jgi:tetratricopeptide (TPR) repeat protein
MVGMTPWICAALLFGAAPAGTKATPAEEAERLAAHAIQVSAERPADALVEARKALSLTADFEPTAYVTAGRKGEVVEDAYVAARTAYRRHRSRIYEAMGEALLRGGAREPAVRYLRRAVLLDGRPEAARRLAAALLATERGREAVGVLLAGPAPLDVATLALAQKAADAAQLPSLQAEIDRVRLMVLAAGGARLEPRMGPLRLPDRARLSTGAPFRADEGGPILFYVAEPSCRSCSSDFDDLRRLTATGVRVIVVPMVPDQDDTLRRALALYHLDWPVLLGAGVAAALDVKAPATLVVARRGWSQAIVKPPLAEHLPPVLQVFLRNDVSETVPRPTWNQRGVDRTPIPPQPGLLPEGLAPGEDTPPPAEFLEAVTDYKEGRPGEALLLFERLEQGADGWLLPPEARLDRAYCLAALGRRDEARRLLLRTGDSRFQDELDRALENVGTAPPRRTKKP